MNNFFESKAPVLYLIGRNGAGKSYTLNSFLSKNPSDAIYISEEGIVKILNQKNRVKIDYTQYKYRV